ncbi:2302_t:CDS:1, partial [Funneliformis geosporum]
TLKPTERICLYLNLKIIISTFCLAAAMTYSESNENRWTVVSELLLLDFLDRRINDVEQLKMRGIAAMKVKRKLWDDASNMLLNSNYNYSAEQCATKWKNIKQNNKKGSTESDRIRIP